MTSALAAAALTTACHHRTDLSGTYATQVSARSLFCASLTHRETAMLRTSTRPRACAEQGLEQKPSHVRRQRYAGRFPRSFAEKHKERAGDPATVGKIEAKGNTGVYTERWRAVTQLGQSSCKRLHSCWHAPPDLRLRDNQRAESAAGPHGRRLYSWLWRPCP
jgi:hypothetical protein